MPTHIYLDNNSTTPLAPEVRDAMMPYLAGKFGNASSIHFAGREAKKALDEARETIMHAVGAANPDGDLAEETVEVLVPGRVREKVVVPQVLVGLGETPGQVVRVLDDRSSG